MTIKATLSSFAISKVNDTTFAITEDDSFRERPIIYAKLHPQEPVLILSDTGCDAPAARSKDARYIKLRDFLENCAVGKNDGKPLNEHGSRSYIVICTHCHFDHIGGIEQFTYDQPSCNVASQQGYDFVTKDLAIHSLCKEQGIRTPKYKIDCWAEDSSRLHYHPRSVVVAAHTYDRPTPGTGEVPLGITIYNTPGHTPDELAWYDEAERHLYVGDSFYKLGDSSDVYGGPIIFPSEGSWVTYMTSMRTLLETVEALNREDGGHGTRVKVGCGHTTSADDAEETLRSLISFFEDVIKGDVPVIYSEEVRGETNSLWRREEEQPMWAVFAPQRLCEEAKQLL